MGHILARILIAIGLAVVLSAAACGCNSGGGHDVQPAAIDGPVTFLTGDNPAGDDDDPTIDIDTNGVIHVVWFSDRDGTKDLYTVQSTGIDLATGIITWSAPLQLTHNDPINFPPPTQGDNFPSLFIDDAGTFHLAWHRWNLNNESHILYMKSDGTPAGWAGASEVDVTSGAHFDRFPNVSRSAAGDLRIYFGTSTHGTFGRNEIFAAESNDDGDTWGAPALVATLNTVAEQSQFPTIVQLPDDTYVATLVRWKLEPSADFFEPTSDVFYAESANGDDWTVEQITVDAGDATLDFVPSIFLDHGGDTHLTWASVGYGDPVADLVQLAVNDRGDFPDSVRTLSSLVGTTDHSPELIPLTAGGVRVYMMVWVRIATPPHNQVVYKVFSRL